MWQDYMDDSLERISGYTKIMSAASEGDTKKFKYFFKNYISKLDKTSKDNKTVLIYASIGNGNTKEKIEIIKTLIDNGADMNFEYDGKTFYELIEDEKLKKWVDDTYPEFVEDLKFKRTVNKYNV